MKSIAAGLFAFVLCTASLCAQDRTREMQEQLKEQGFYFGQMDGVSGPEFSAALRRFQIRNGLEVTGQENPETLSALGLDGAGAAPAPPATPAAPVRQRATPPAPTPRPRVDLRRNEAVVESDRRALREEEQSRIAPRERSVVAPPADAERSLVMPPEPTFGRIYLGTPYAAAPRGLQAQTLVAAQRLLARDGFYREEIDGLPGPAMEEALLSYQRSLRLPRTGRLDLDTLNALHLLPGPNSANPVLKPFSAPRSHPRTYRGIWVE